MQPSAVQDVSPFEGEAVQSYDGEDVQSSKGEGMSPFENGGHVVL